MVVYEMHPSLHPHKWLGLEYEEEFLADNYNSPNTNAYSSFQNIQASYA